ncbi:hypothetical protein ACWD04_31700 [Streptomyces sp. NPDC002911]
MPEEFYVHHQKLLAGAVSIDEVGTAITRLCKEYEGSLAFDPQNTPWGDDEYGKRFYGTYKVLTATMRDGVGGFGSAMEKVAELTKASGSNFRGAQNDAETAIHNSGRRN